MRQYTRVRADNEKLFAKTIELLIKAFPNGISRGRAVTPVNLYEALAVGVALALKQGKNIDAAALPALINDQTLKSYTGAGSNQKKFVIGRIEYVRDAL
ncbi:hypothetical protein PsaNZ64_30695 [Pseudomonas syringae pv. actinidiae]|uniref:hypothetical protein n=1 Tax=Pseudomonas syringae TaxID=317 RepID=UPI00095BC19F|nr:hypothetical protein [Pseudomonas syringae]OKS63571.1 hypothetical protein PsaNZ64_30695 [Pseudomonas syringae pv. actinidiae]